MPFALREAHGATVVVVTHSAHVAQTADRVITFVDGRAVGRYGLGPPNPHRAPRKLIFFFFFLKKKFSYLFCDLEAAAT